MAAPIARPQRLCINGSEFSLPAFFPSVSSVKTNLEPLKYLHVLVSFNYPTFLFSAYDWYAEEPVPSNQVQRVLRKGIAQGQTVLLDSGAYERFWRSDADWGCEQFQSVLKRGNVSFAFCLEQQDVYTLDDVASLTDATVGATRRDCAAAVPNEVLPIVHSTNFELLPDVCRQVSLALSPSMIGIPERDLGNGLLERGLTLRHIRTELNETGRYVPIHLLGTGNPLAILWYTLCGADSYDGLEWCQTVVDHETGTLHHFQQREMLAAPVDWTHFPELDYIEKTLLHNLVFFRRWMQNIGQSAATNSLVDLLHQQYPNAGVLYDIHFAED